MVSILLEHQFLKYFLPFYITIFFLVGFLLKTIKFRKKYKIDPLVEGKSDKLQKSINSYKMIILASGLLTILIYSFFPQYYWIVIPFEYMETNLIKSAGLLLLIVAIILVRISQDNLGRSWRIGVDRVNKMELITTGIYSRSRNPIAFGMLLLLIGLFLVIPNAVLFGIVCSSLIIVNVRIILEEEHMLKTLGKEYEEYYKKTRKWI
jgi:protein-S-isoprenylcysteine O-methyltransferase Ste14